MKDIGILNYKNPKSIGNRFRKKRFELFQNLIEDKFPLKILDIGGTQLFWESMNFHKKEGVEITLLNLNKEQTKYPNFIGVVGDATNLSEFSDNEFDIVFSNSVIEHLFKKENQVKMANEVMRVGKNYFIQTPNLYFPIEPHFMFPFFQFLPYSVQMFLLTKTKLIRKEKHSEQFSENILKEIKLLSQKEFVSLFPDSKLFKEKILGLTKSFVLYKFE